MKTHRHRLYSSIKTTVACGILVALAASFSGCIIMGFLASGGPFESKKAPEFDLKKNQDKKILLWIETPRSMAIFSHDLDKLVNAFKGYMILEMKIKPENLFVHPASKDIAVQDPQNVARSLGAGYVLLVQVDTFELDSLQMKDYVTGHLITRAILLDVDASTAVWPKKPEGKMIHIAVEVETGGREAAISRLVSGAAQCTLRYLYPCDKLKFKYPYERVSSQEVFEIETY